MEEYHALYAEFMKKYSAGTTTSENVGELIAHLAGFYPHYNGLLVKAERSLALVARDEAMKTDEATGKAISSAKAEVITAASSEANIYKQAKMHIENLEMLIQSAKALQRGLIQEMAHGGLQ